MKKVLLTLTVLFGTILTCLAQADTSAALGIGVFAGVPSGPARNIYGSTTGLSFKFEFPFTNSRVRFTASTGIAVYSLKSVYSSDTSKQSGHFVPLEVGIKYYLYKGFYIEGDLGTEFNINTSYLGYQSAFMYSPMAGISLPVKQNTAAVDLGLKYESRIEQDGNINQFALQVAYRFGL